MERVLDLDTAHTTLDELVAQLAGDETVLIVRNSRPVARLSAVSALPETTTRRIPGLMRGAIEVVSEDDEHLADFAEYVQ